MDLSPPTLVFSLNRRDASRDRATRTGEITMTKYMYITKCLTRFGPEKIPVQKHPYPSNMDFIHAQE